ncbi:MAG: hypothetical protein GY778_27495 [bacterium]|nr:hypothetical protein [bacterium]
MKHAGLVALAAGVVRGQCCEIDGAASIPDEIIDRHETTTVRSRPRPLWDRGWLLAGLIGLLSVEWAVRKWSRLL